MPPVENTATSNFETLKVQDGDDVQTALLMVESLPAGSTLYLGANPVAQADANGRATIKLAPGAHEVKVAAPSGGTAIRTVTVTTEERGSLKKITMPLEEAAKTTAMPAAGPSVAKKLMAVGASIVLVVVLLAGAYFAFRGKAQSDAPPIQDLTVRLIEPPDLSSTEGDAKKIAEKLQKAQSATEKARLEKELAEVRKKLNEEKKAAENKPAAPAPSVSVVTPQPAEPEPPPPGENQSDNACVLVSVSAPEGTMMGRFRVSIIAQSISTDFGGHLNPKGRWRMCNLTPGLRITVALFGPRGARLATRQSVLSAGNNFIEFAASSTTDVAPDRTPDNVPPPERGRRRPRFQRP
jgi:hypothetical protein